MNIAVITHAILLQSPGFFFEVTVLAFFLFSKSQKRKDLKLVGFLVLMMILSTFFVNGGPQVYKAGFKAIENFIQ